MKLRRFLLILIFILAISRSVAYFFNYFPLERFGYSLGISPLPMVFTTVFDINIFTAKYFIVAVDGEGNETVIPRKVPPEDLSMAISFLNPFYFIKVLDDAYFNPIIRYFYCSQNESYEKILIKIDHVTYGEAKTDEKWVQCL